MQLNSIDDEWSAFLKGEPVVSNNNNNTNSSTENNVVSGEPELIELKPAPECDELYISTKTKILFLNRPVDVEDVFWKLPIIQYWEQKEGIIKKQIKIVSKTKEEYETYQQKLTTLDYYTENVLKQIDNPTARRLKFKDERKITVGISKKDILNSRGKQKGAFYNCFAMILRIWVLSEYKEIHVKVFNTGKLEIPGVLNNDLMIAIQHRILETLRPYMQPDPQIPLNYIGLDVEKNVLINSNFKCGFRVKREALQNVLRTKYKIETAAIDTCSYPGLKSRYYYKIGVPDADQNGCLENEDNALKIKELIKSNKYVKVTFMVFQTGSCLIVGKCSENVLRLVYDFLKQVLTDEYAKISIKGGEETQVKEKKTKLRKKSVLVTKDYYNKHILGGGL